MKNKQQLVIKSAKNGIKKFLPETNTYVNKTEPNEFLEKLRLFHFYNSIKDDNSKIARQVLDEMNKSKNLSFVNTIEKVAKEKELEKAKVVYHNAIPEVNKPFEIKKVEPNKHSRRVGLLGYKMGMTSTWDRWGIRFPLTVIKVDRNQITEVITDEKDGYFGIQVGCGEHKTPTRPMLGYFMKKDLPPKKDLCEFRITKENILPMGYMLSVRHFLPGQLVDVRGTSKGKGWQGVMKRWNFKGGVASHGNSKKHRGGGSIGNREKPGRVFKGKRMAGQLGNESIVTKHLLVYKIDYTNGLLYLKGSVPGNKGGLLEIYDSKWKQDKQWKMLPYPTFIEEKGKTYPDVMLFTDTKDLNEVYHHDNDEVLGVSEEEEEGEPEAGEEGAEEGGAAAGATK
jgi:large subunit ribosomal protein L3